MSNPKFKIVSYPDFKCIAPKAMVSYHAEPVDPVKGTIPEGTSFKWICFNDPTTLRKYGSHLFKGPKTQNWKRARWGVAGRHTIALFVSHPDGTQDIYERKQWVDSASNILGREFDPKSNDGLPRAISGVKAQGDGPQGTPRYRKDDAASGGEERGP